MPRAPARVEKRGITNVREGDWLCEQDHTKKITASPAAGCQRCQRFTITPETPGNFRNLPLDVALRTMMELSAAEVPVTASKHLY